MNIEGFRLSCLFLKGGVVRLVYQAGLCWTLREMFRLSVNGGVMRMNKLKFGKTRWEGDTSYVKAAKLILVILRLADFPLYFSRFSKKTYTLHQHFVLLVIRQIEGKSYRVFSGRFEGFE